MSTSPTYRFEGKHYYGNYVGCDHDAMINIDVLRDKFRDAIIASGATILTEADHLFEGNGYTSTVVLSESHASVHTYPEHNSCFIDLFTCGDKCRHEPFEETMIEYLKPSYVISNVIIRNDRPP